MDERERIISFLDEYCATHQLLHWQKRIVEQVSEGNGVCLPHVKGSRKFLDELFGEYAKWKYVD